MVTTDEFINEPMVESQLPDFEEVDFIPISAKYWKVLLLNWAIFSLILLIGFGVLYYFLSEEFGLIIWLILTVILLLIGFGFAQMYFGFSQRKYAIREHDVMYHHGWIKREIMMIPFNRIQHVELKEGWFSRQLGLKSLAVFTASSSDLTINGLPKEVAESFNQFILNKIVEEDLEEEKIYEELTALEDAEFENKESNE